MRKLLRGLQRVSTVLFRNTGRSLQHLQDRLACFTGLLYRVDRCRLRAQSFHPAQTESLPTRSHHYPLDRGCLHIESRSGTAGSYEVVDVNGHRYPYPIGISASACSTRPRNIAPQSSKLVEKHATQILGLFCLEQTNKLPRLRLEGAHSPPCLAPKLATCIVRGMGHGLRC
jgi:hypothetical protein